MSTERAVTELGTVRREITRSLALTIAYDAATDDQGRREVVQAIRASLDVALEAYREAIAEAVRT